MRGKAMEGGGRGPSDGARNQISALLQEIGLGHCAQHLLPQLHCSHSGNDAVRRGLADGGFADGADGGGRGGGPEAEPALAWGAGAWRPAGGQVRQIGRGCGGGMRLARRWSPPGPRPAGSNNALKSGGERSGGGGPEM